MNTQKKAWIFNEIKGYIFMLIGCAAYAFSTIAFLEPCSIVAGGVTGLATLIHLLNKNIPIGVTSIVINLPIFLLGLRYCGKKFIFRSLLTVASLGVVTDLFALFMPPMTADPILAGLYGGICQGIGIGLFVRYEFSSGGTELFGRLLSKWFKVDNIPVLVGVCDALIVAAGAVFLKSADNILYALIVVFVSTKVSEIVLLGLEKSKLCIIISDKGEEISKTLLAESPRGVTMLDGKGMYTEKPHNVLLTCVKNRQLTQLRKIVRSIDENAFVIVNESVEVRGKGFKNWDKEQ